MSRNVKLLDALAFGGYRYGKCPSVTNVVDILVDKIAPPAGKRSKYRKTMCLVLVNLYHAYVIDDRLPVAISLGRGEFFKGRTMAKLYLNYDIFTETIDFLRDNQYIYQYPGFFDEDKEKKFRTRIKSTPKLNKLLKRYFQEGRFYYIKPAIELRDKNKNSVLIKPNQMHSLMRPVNRLNKFINRHSITLDMPLDKLKEYHIIPDMYCGYQRVFNNESFCQGGRFYGHWSQQIPKECRSHIKIDDQNTVEVDFSAYHLHMIYFMEPGYQLPSGDLYDVGLNIPELRPIIKKAIMIYINADKSRSAGAALVNEIKTFIKENPYIINVPSAKQIKQAILNKHPILNKYFSSNYGIFLQRIDSDIAETIMTSLMAKNIVCLCIHDSFIVQKQHEHLLKYTMDLTFQSFFNQSCPIK